MLVKWMAEKESLLEEQNKLLRLLTRLEIDDRLEEKTEKEKAKYLKEAGFTNQEVANIMNKTKSTISTQLSRLEDD